MWSTLTLEIFVLLQNRKPRWEVKLLFSCKMKNFIYKSEAMHANLTVNTLPRIDLIQKIKDPLRNTEPLSQVLLWNTYQVAIWNAYLIKSQTLSWAWERCSWVELQCSDSSLEGDLREFQIIKAFTLQKQEIDWKTFKYILFLQSYQKVDTKQWKNKKDNYLETFGHKIKKPNHSASENSNFKFSFSFKTNTGAF